MSGMKIKQLHHCRTVAISLAEILDYSGSSLSLTDTQTLKNAISILTEYGPAANDQETGSPTQLTFKFDE